MGQDKNLIPISSKAQCTKQLKFLQYRITAVFSKQTQSGSGLRPQKKSHSFRRTATRLGEEV